VNQVIENAWLEDGVVDLDLSGEPVGQAIDDIISALKDEIAAREAQISWSRTATPCPVFEPTGAAFAPCC
jgi:hypothetical protein